MNENKRDEYLYGISTTGMTMIMTFLIGKISSQFITFIGAQIPGEDVIKILAGGFILLTCLVSIVGIILTLSVAHKEFNLPFNYINFVMAIFFVSLPLFIAADIINSSLLLDTKNQIDFNKNKFNYGMIFFIASFGFLLIYLAQVFASEQKPRSIPNTVYFQIAMFHIAGIIFGCICLVIGNYILLLLLSFGAALCSGFYLYFLWNTRKTIQRAIMQNDSPQVSVGSLPGSKT